MGYCIDWMAGDFTIPADKLEEAFELLKALNHKPGVHKNGGSWQNGKEISRHFSWMDVDYDKKSKDAADILEQVGFDTTYDEVGNLSITGWNFEKAGQEDLFLSEISHLANDGWFIQFHGEDGTVFRYTADGYKEASFSF